MKQTDKQKLLDYIQYTPNLIDQKMLDQVAIKGVDVHKAYVIYLSLLCGFEENEQLIDELEKSIIQLDNSIYLGQYFDLIKYYDQIEFQSIPKYQCILLNEEPIRCGYFVNEVSYPKYHDLVLDPGYIQRINSIVEKVSGEITLFGFGLGYLAYKLKESGKVDFIHIYERNLELYQKFNDAFGCLGIVSLNELDDSDCFELADTIIIDQRSINEDDLHLIESKINQQQKVIYIK